MVESFLFSIAESLIKKLSSCAYEEAFQAFNFHKDLEELKRTLSIVKAVLLDAEVKQEQTQGLREWLRQIKDVFSIAQDVLDELECHVKEKQVLQNYGSTKKKVCRFLSCTPLAFRFRMAREIKEIRDKLHKVATDGDQFRLEKIEVERGVINRREMTYSHVNASDVIGRDLDKENIIKYLFQTHPGVDAGMALSVVPIVGIGGMGKTTLAKYVFSDARIDKQFPLKMWVCVSDDFNIKSLMIKIVRCVSPLLGGDLEIEQLYNHFKNSVAHRKFLLVLDDVWNVNRVKWIDLKNLLQVSEGSRILVTTRNKGIAEMVGTISPYELEGLSDENSFTMFIKWAFKGGEEKNYPNLEDIGRGIISKCRGVPLAVRTLASSLFLKFNEKDWKFVRDNGIWDLPLDETTILPALKLSYDQMPSSLKPCFSLFSLYPKNFEFDSIDVTEFLVALGLLQPSDETSKVDEIVMQYLHELHSRCFLQDFVYFGYFYTFKMHDLVHDLAVYVAKDEFLMVNFHPENIPEKCRHLSIVENDLGGGQNEGLLFYVMWSLDRKSYRMREWYYVEENAVNLALFPKSKSMKTIMFPVEGVGLKVNSQVLLNEWLSRYNYLRVLNLSDSTFETLPKSIGKMRFLRHLNLSFNQFIKRLPNSICELQSLQTLLLKGCMSLEALPKGLRKLISLRQLAITTKEFDLSKTDVASLTSLQILSFEYCYPLKSLLGGIQQLTSLKELSIHGCWGLNSLNFSIKHLPELVALSIVKCYNLELLEGHDNRETTRMKLRFVRFEDLPRLLSLPEWLHEAADTLHTLMIGICRKLVVLPDWLPTFSQLNTLRIEGCTGLLSLPNNMNGFRALERLEIVGCPELERKCEYECGEYWPNLSRLKFITTKG